MSEVEGSGEITEAPAEQTTTPPAATESVSTPTETTEPTVTTAHEELPTEKPGAFPDDWRERFSKGDEKRLNVLKRISSVDALVESFFEKEKKIRSGELKTTYNPEASPEDQAQWRKENGIPEAAEKYEVAPPEGVVLGEIDSEIINEYKEVAFKELLTPGQFNNQVNWFLNTQQKMLDKVNGMVAESDAKAKAEAEDTLRDMYGGDYKPNMNALANFMESMSPELKEAFQGARLGNGKPILADAGMVAHLVQMQRELNPATLVPGGNAYNETTVNDRLEEIRTKIMGTEAYTEKIAQEYRLLLEAEAKYQTRK